jgi:hypothetical protein
MARFSKGRSIYSDVELAFYDASSSRDPVQEAHELTSSMVFAMERLTEPE